MTDIDPQELFAVLHGVPGEAPKLREVAARGRRFVRDCPEYREPDCWIDDDGRMQCNRCKDQVLAFKDGGWACSCDSAMFEWVKDEKDAEL